MSNTVATIEIEAAPTQRTESLSRLKRWSALLAKFVSVQIVVQALGLVTGLLLVRALSQREYAYYTLANTMQATLLLLADVGVGSALSATGGKVWQDRQRFGELIQTGLHVRKKLAWIGGAVAIPVLAWLLLSNHTGIPYALILIVVVLLGANFRLTNDVLTVVPKMHARIDQLQKLDLIAAAFRLVAVAAACYTFVNAAVGVLIGSISFGIQFILLKRWASEGADPSASPNAEDKTTIIRIIKQQAPNSIYYCLQSQLTVFVISIFGSTQSIAEIGALGRLGMLFSIIGTVMTNVVSPRFARCQDRKRVKAMYWQIIGASVVLSLALLSEAIAFPKPLLWLLGKSYSHLANALAYVVMSSLISMIVGTIYSLNASRGWLKGVWLAAPITFAAQVILVPLVNLHSIQGVVLLNCIPAALSVIPCICLGYIETNRKDDLVIPAI